MADDIHPEDWVRSPGLAEMVAARLRERIVNGELEDGARLPKQEDLIAQFAVSAPTLREALRILESEGLISVRRGYHGGAVVHSPSDTAATFGLGLVLQSRGADMQDLAFGLSAIEPLLVGLCAQRPDRHEEVVPRLRQVNERTEATLEDEFEYIHQVLAFHRVLATSSGNATVDLVGGALELLWTTQTEDWPYPQMGEHIYTVEGARAAYQDHIAITDAIDDGDAELATRLASEHSHQTRTVWLERFPGQQVNVTRRSIQDFIRLRHARRLADPPAPGRDEPTKPKR